MKRDSFVFYRSFYEAINELTDEEQLTMYRTLAKYALEGDMNELDGVCKIVFTLVKPQLDANNKKYTDGKKGGRPPKTTETF